MTVWIADCFHLLGDGMTVWIADCFHLLGDGWDDRVDCWLLPPSWGWDDRVDCWLLPPSWEWDDRVDCWLLPPSWEWGSSTTAHVCFIIIMLHAHSQPYSFGLTPSPCVVNHGRQHPNWELNRCFTALKIILLSKYDYYPIYMSEKYVTCLEISFFSSQSELFWKHFK